MISTSSQNRANAEQCLQHWRQWSENLTREPVIQSMLKGGLTNCNWLVRSELGEWVLRVNHPRSSTLGINRANELRVLKTIANLNISPPLIYSDPNFRYQITAYIPGTVWNLRHLKSAENLDRIQSLIARYQQLPFSCEPRNYLTYLDNYRQQLSDQALTLTDWLRFDQCHQQLQALDGYWPEARLCHHDLVPGNIIETQDQLYLLDWEYAAPGCGELDYLAIGATESVDPLARELYFWLNRLWYLVQET